MSLSTYTYHACCCLLQQLKKAQAEAADATSQLQVLDHAVKTLESGDQDAIKHQYIDAVRRMAVTQVRRAGFANQECQLQWSRWGSIPFIHLIVASYVAFQHVKGVLVWKHQ